MLSVRNIKINGKIYELPEKTINSKETFSGNVYRLQVENEELAVKIYHSINRDDPDDIDFFPPQEDLEKFIEISPKMDPILLSNHMVLDLENNYIGCTSYFVEETKKDIGKVIRNLPCNQLFTNIFLLIERIPEVSKYRIALDDWSLDNLKYGTIRNQVESEKIYCFDDSNYRMNKEDSIRVITNTNYACANRLAEDILGDLNLYHVLFGKMRYSSCYFEYLERQCRGYKNLEEYSKEYTLKK